jgi:phosphate ABC transporter phosphate-binding protein
MITTSPIAEPRAYIQCREGRTPFYPFAVFKARLVKELCFIAVKSLRATYWQVPKTVAIGRGMPNFRIILIAISALALLTASVYGGIVETSPLLSSSLGPSVTLNGAGATLTYPLLSNIGHAYETIHPNIFINYQPIGSIAGINAHIARTVDFGATYPPLTHEQSLRAPHTLHIPESISAVVLGYNVLGIDGKTPLPTGLHLNGTVIAKMFLGNITRWNDPGIASLNPGLALPDRAIQTIHDTLAEGGTFVFTSYLASVSSDFNATVGRGTIVQWPVGLSVPGNQGITNLIQSTPGSIGYIELAYALLSNVPYASIRNPAGNFIEPSLESARAADNQLTKTLPAGNETWSGISLLNEPAPDAYPIVTFTYIIVYQDLSVIRSMDLNKAKVLANYLWYLVHDGQSLAPALAYVPLPSNIVAIDESSIKSLMFNGTPVFS